MAATGNHPDWGRRLPPGRANVTMANRVPPADFVCGCGRPWRAGRQSGEGRGMDSRQSLRQRLYADLAWLWPIVSPPEVYEEQSACYRDLIVSHAKRPVVRLLDLGCGAGHHTLAFGDGFDVTGVDCSEAMLALARAHRPRGVFHVGDIRSVRLDARFDAVLLHDAVSYMLTEEDLRAALATAYRHIEPGGVLLTLAEYTTETFEEGSSVSEPHCAGDIEVTLIEHLVDPDPGDTICEAHLEYIIRENGQTRTEIDPHTWGLFPLALWRRQLRAAGFHIYEAEFEETSVACPVFVCKRPEE